MARHARPSGLTGSVVITALIVVLAIALVVLLTPELPSDRVYQPDVRIPVPMPGPSYLPPSAP